MSQFEFWSFVIFSFLLILSQFEFELCCNLCFSVLSQFKLWSFVTNCVLEFCDNLSFLVLSHFVFLCFVTIFKNKKSHYCHYCHYCQYCHYWHNCHNGVTFWVLMFGHTLSIEFCHYFSLFFFIFVTIQIFEFCHNLCFIVLSRFNFF